MSVSLPVRLLGVALAGPPSSPSPPAAPPSTRPARRAPPVPSRSASATCDPASMKTKTAGTLTIGTDKPAYEPWFIDDDPSNGKGFESAVAYAVADQLGFAKDKVNWVVAPFNTVIAARGEGLRLRHQPGVDQRRAQEGRRLLLRLLRRAPGRHHLQGQPDRRQDLGRRPQGRQARRPGRHDLLHRRHGPDRSPSQDVAVFDTNDLAVQALKNRQIDGIVADLPTAFYMTAAQLDDGVIVGQLPAAGGTPSSSAPCSTRAARSPPASRQAVDALRADGTLDTLVSAVAVDRRALPS